MSRALAFHVTERCGLQCRHCLRDPGKQRADLPLELVERLLPEARALHGIRHAGFTGGDPLLWPQLEGALDACVRHGFTWHVVTSGRGFDRLLAMLDEDPERRESLTMVDLSLDGATDATHDAIRGEGSFREVMVAAAACSAGAIPFSLQMTIHARNVAEMEQVALLAGDLGARKVGFSPMNATGRPEDRDLYLPPAELDQARNRIERLSALLSMEVTGFEGFRHGDRFHVCESFRSDVLSVTPHGMLNLCCAHSGIPGSDEDVVADLATTSLAEAHDRLLVLVHRMQRERLAEIAATPEGASAWGDFPCNWCLAKLGKPHWVEGGSVGPAAVRLAAVR